MQLHFPLVFTESIIIMHSLYDVFIENINMNANILLIFNVRRILMKVNTINQRMYIKVNTFSYLKNYLWNLSEDISTCQRSTMHLQASLTWICKSTHYIDVNIRKKAEGRRIRYNKHLLWILSRRFPKEKMNLNQLIALL